MSKKSAVKSKAPTEEELLDKFNELPTSEEAELISEETVLRDTVTPELAAELVAEAIGGVFLDDLDLFMIAKNERHRVDITLEEPDPSKAKWEFTMHLRKVSY